MKKVSVITVCFNSSKTIRDTVESVLAQDYPNIEYIIVDGGSTDGTMDIVCEYRHKISHVISEPDRGIYDAMNKGIRVSTGDIVGMLNSDDIYLDSSVISDIVNQFDLSNADSVYADLVIVDRKNIYKVIRFCSSKNFTVSHLRWGWMIPHPTFFVKRTCYDAFGLYKLDYRVSADFEMIARLFWKKGISFSHLSRCIVRMRNGGISTTGFLWRIHQNLEIVRACKENGIYTNIFFILFKVPFKLLEYFKSGTKNVN
ncbi:glycosyltransferase [Microbulbifer thermotolerans]|uniref:glycosyltransferase family 2 protein n=1 Tax=Microbulbifer thermotolerans TaxID=252514 RepID=UPI00224B5360|nr:glycosyltransferase family 2 protein [Microbulbifer thermotolerans]MCX2840244.1 glycosyltransferase [Microbulbifer thermotolerans]